MPQTEKFPNDEKYNRIQKLLILRTIRLDKMVPAIMEFVR